ncbi:hypothetical protein AGABI2DRAFT_75119, partial [Agaricus bisporus var. bisporus H97]|uniref:hypothetical protein n=1 Tax=Agaricus bisporus var. bisporus (strain H97 / ATCC MYA-4626 / FGSC 10389) TaxID=936046 RepID=UPI00029F7DD0
ETLLKWGVEIHGISPTDPSERTDLRLYQMFFVWFTSNFNILAFSTGSAAPAFFGMDIKHCVAIFIVVDTICCAIPAYFAVFGPKLGTRGMVQCRYSWGYPAAVIPSLLNVFSMQGFLILNCIVGGQTLAAVSPDKLNATLGIVIIGVISMLVSDFSPLDKTRYEMVTWVPNCIIFFVMLGVGGKHLNPSTFSKIPTPSPSSVISCATFIASSVISWCTMTPDYGVYHNRKASTFRIFIYTYLGFFCASISMHMLGAAFGIAAIGVPSYTQGFDNGNDIGGLVAAILEPTGGFGKLCLVLMALSVPAACAPTMYTFGMSFMAVAPFFAKIPRYVYVIISEAILIPIAIIGQTRFYTTLVNILSVIGYWSSAFAAIILTEHFIFRQTKFSNYLTEFWDIPSRLPLGLAALFAFLGAFGIIVPSMSQAFYEGPIAKAGSGDIGVIVGFLTAGLVFLGFRFVERKLTPYRDA